MRHPIRSLWTLLFVRLLPVCLGLMILAGTAAPAMAQVYDRLINLDDDGFDPFPAGGTIQLTLDVTNNGPDVAPATDLFIDVPTDGTLEAVTGGFTCAGLPAAGGTTVTCAIPALADDETVSVVLELTAPSETVLVTRARITEPGDADQANNDDPSLDETTTITSGSELQLDATVPAGAVSGEVIALVYTATNNGPNDSTASILEFPIPAGLTNVDPPPNCALASGRYRCTVGPLAVGATRTLTFGAQVFVAGGSSVTSTASLSDVVPGDADVSNNTQTQVIAITGGTDLSVTKSRAPADDLLVGESTTFTLDPRYTGESPTGITLVDTVPDEYDVDTITAPGWTVTRSGPNPRTLTFERAGGGGTAGANVPLGAITIDVTAIAPGNNVVNAATISQASGPDSNPGNDTDDDGGVAIEAAVVDLVPVKTGQDPPLAVTGQDYRFALRARNAGTLGYVGTVRLVDDFPAGMTLTGLSEPAGWTCTVTQPPSPTSLAPPVAGPGRVVCDFEYLPGAPLAARGGLTSPVLLDFDVTSGSFANGLEVVAVNPAIPEEPGDTANNTTTTTVTGSAPGDTADLRVLKTATNASVIVGDQQTFQIEIVNDGPVTATDVILNDRLSALFDNVPGNVTVTSNEATVSASAPNCNLTQDGSNAVQLRCEIASLPVCTAGNGSCLVLDVTVRTGLNGATRSNSARAVSQQTADPDLGNNSGSVSYTTVERTDVAVVKTSSATSVPAGQNVTYVIAASTLPGFSDAANVEITDTLPANVVFLSASPTCGTTPAVGTVTAGGEQVICQLGTIAQGQQQTVTIVVRPTNAAGAPPAPGNDILNSVTVSTTTDEPNQGNNAASFVVSVQPANLDLLVNKRDTVDPVTIGADTVYVVTIGNNGPSASENAILRDRLPPSRLSYRTVIVPPDAICQPFPAANSFGGVIDCRFPTILSGETREIRVTMRATAKGSIPNNAEIDSDEIDPLAPATDQDRLAANNAIAENTTIRTLTDLRAVSKTATPAAVSLEDNFVYTLVVNVGPSRQEADGVVVTDTLPAGMFLTGTPTVAVDPGGAASGTTCGGAAGATSFTCALGTVDADTTLRIDVPVEVRVRPTSGTITNTFTVTTTSEDSNATDNAASGAVVVDVSSIAGQVYRDFADNAVRDGGDNGVFDLEITLTGTTTDGAGVVRTVRTAADGTYLFDGLPSGTYTVSRAVPAEPNLDGRPAQPGSQGGTSGGDTTISAIVLPGATASTDNDFRLRPQARIGVAKAVTNGPVLAGDGSFTVTFGLAVENLGADPLSGVAVADPLAGAAPAFGTRVTRPDPLADPLLPGQYVILAAPSGSCGGLRADFDGSGQTALASGFGLGAGVTCTISFRLRVQPPDVSTAFENQATATGTGVNSGQAVSDTSDAGTDPDPNGNGDPGDAGEDDPTPVVQPSGPAEIAVSKLVVADTLGTPAAPGQTITYEFVVRNAGGLFLNDVTIDDPLLTPTRVAPAVATLAPGETRTFRRDYAIVQADIDLGRVENQATASGLPAGGGPAVSDLSGDTLLTDAPTVTPLAQGGAGISLAKSVDPASLPARPVAGDVVTFDFAVTNTGNVTLTNVTVVERLAGAVVSGNPIASLAPGATDTTTITADYTLTPADIANRTVTNDADVTGTFTPAAPGDPDTVTASASITAPVAAILAVTEPETEFAGDGGSTGSVLGSDLLEGAPARLETVAITVDASDPGLTLDPATGILTLAPGQPAGRYTVTYTIASRADPTLTSTTTETVVQLPRAGLETVKTQARTDEGDGLPGVGDTVTYTITARNTGNAPLTSVVPADTLTDRRGTPRALDAGPAFVSADAGSPEGRLEIGETATWTASVVIDQAFVDAGGLSNSVTVSAQVEVPAGFAAVAAISDVSDDGDDADGNTVDDPTVLALALLDRASAVTMVKTTPRGTVRRGGIVPWTIVIGNSGASDFGPVDLRDRLPEGFVYVDGSAALDGVPATVIVRANAGDVVFPGVVVPAAGQVTATLSSRILTGTRPGTHVNVARLIDPATGARTGVAAQAEVRLLPEAVFDCGEVIGKVFDDLDGDGHQDPPGADRGITDQDIFDGKGGKSAKTAVLPEAAGTEAGIPSARLATVDGLLVTTDEYGRFSVPCAALPRDRGTNFLLKLDPSSLPSGYRVTTENPRVMRLTPGMMTEMNFGAARARLLRVDLDAAAFGPGGAASPALDAGLVQLAARAGPLPAILALGYRVPAAAGPGEVAQARARLDAVERRLRGLWRGAGYASPRIETTIVRAAP